MLVSVIRASFGVILTVCLAGCGGSNSGSGVCVTDCGGGGNPTTVTYTFTGAMPTAVATQIGSGAYTQATVASGKVSISLPSGTSNYSIAWVCPTTDENVIMASVKDGTSFTSHCDSGGSTGTTDSAAFQVETSAISGGTDLDIESLSESEDWGPLQPGLNSTTLSMITGTYNVFVQVIDMNDDVLAVKVLPNQTIPGALNGGNPVVFSASDKTTNQTATVHNNPSGSSLFNQFMHFEAPDLGNYWDLQLHLPGQQNQYAAYPPNAIPGGDFYQFGAAAYVFPNETVSGELDTTSNAPPTVTLPAPWAYAGPTPNALPTFNIDYTGFSSMTNVVLQARIGWWIANTQSGQDSYQIQLSATANYQNGATSVSIPDLSGLTGFIAPPASGTSVDWSAGVQQGFPLLTSPPNGTMLAVNDSGEYTEP
jgi:hypothetical protein